MIEIERTSSEAPVIDIDSRKKEIDPLALQIRGSLVGLVRSYGESYTKKPPPKGRIARFKYRRELKQWQRAIALRFNPRDEEHALSDEEQEKISVIDRKILEESGYDAQIKIAAFGEVDKARRTR